MNNTGGAPPRRLTTSTAERTAQVVDEVLERAAADGERIAAWARMALCGLVALTWPLANTEGFVTGTVAVIGVEAIALGGLLFSAWLLVRLRRGLMTPALRTLSITGDAVLVLGVLAGFVARPPDVSYPGVDRLSGFGVVYLAIFAAGLRLSRRAAWMSSTVFALGITVLIIMDRLRNQMAGSPSNIITAYILVLTAAVCAWLVAKRTRELVLEGAEKALMAERARSRLGAYVSQEVADASLKEDEVRLGGRRQDVAVLFSDLRGFTSSSEHASPEQVVQDLNEYFEGMVGAIRGEGGVVDKYIGDAIMAVFGAPTQRPDDAVRAIRAAWGMERALEELNRRRAARGQAPLQHGVGVHFGVAVAGNIGTAERAQYTVIGDTVNVASRLESATKEAGRSVLVSSSVRAAAGAAQGLPDLVHHGAVRVKGREEALDVYTFA